MEKEEKREIWASLGKLGQGKFGRVRASLASLGKFGYVWESLGKFGQVWASQGKLWQGNNLEKWGEGRKNKKRKQQMGKGNKNLSGDGEEGEEGGESRVQNSPKAFGELKKY